MKEAMSMKTIRSPKVAEAPPQTWSNMKVVNGYFHIAGMTGSGPKASIQATAFGLPVHIGVNHRLPDRGSSDLMR